MQNSAPLTVPETFIEDGYEIRVSELPPTPDLTVSERALLTLVVAYSREFGKCRVSNARLAELLGRSADRTGKLVISLARKKYLVRRLTHFNLRTYRVLKPSIEFEARLEKIDS